MKYIKLNLADCSNGQKNSLMKVLDKVTYGLTDTAIYLTVEDWQANKKAILSNSKKYKAIQYNLIEFENGAETKQLSQPDKAFGKFFLQLERAIA